MIGLRWMGARVRAGWHWGGCFRIGLRWMGARVRDGWHWGGCFRIGLRWMGARVRLDGIGEDVLG